MDDSHPSTLILTVSGRLRSPLCFREVVHMLLVSHLKVLTSRWSSTSNTSIRNLFPGQKDPLFNHHLLRCILLCICMGCMVAGSGRQSNRSSNSNRCYLPTERLRICCIHSGLSIIQGWEVYYILGKKSFWYHYSWLDPLFSRYCSCLLRVSASVDQAGCSYRGSGVIPSHNSEHLNKSYDSQHPTVRHRIQLKHRCGV